MGASYRRCLLLVWKEINELFLFGACRRREQKRGEDEKGDILASICIRRSTFQFTVRLIWWTQQMVLTQGEKRPAEKGADRNKWAAALFIAALFRKRHQRDRKP
jgi:hypothetical protein